MSNAAFEPLPFSLSQREIWLDQQAHPDTPLYNIGGCCFLEGPLDTERLERALATLVAHSEALRLLPLPAGGQRLQEWRGPFLEQHDLSATPDPQAAVRTWWQAQFEQPIPLDGRTRPWRIALLRAGPACHGVMVKFHHLVMDGWGTSLLFQHWSERYNAPTADESADDGVRQYLRFITESHAYAASNAFTRDAAFWRRVLPRLPPPLLEPHRGDANHSNNDRAHVHVHRLPRHTYARLCRFAEAQGGTVFHLLLAALALYFGRLAGHREVVIGTPSLNRGGGRYKRTLGMFVGVSPLVIGLPEGACVGQLLAGVGAALRRAYRHQRYPLSAIADDLGALRAGRDRLFDLLLSFERQDYAVQFGEAVLTEARQLFSARARYPLAVTVCEFHPEQPVELVLEAAAGAFDAEGTALLGLRLQHLLERMAVSPDSPIDQLELVPAQERRALIEGLHADVPRHDHTTPFVTAFERQAALHPSADALLWADGRWSYADLNHHANRITRRVQTLGVRPGQIVALAMARSPEYVAALLAVAKAGAAFLPLDVEAPPARLADLLAASEPAALLTQTALCSRFEPLHPHTLAVVCNESAEAESEPDPPGPGADDLAYVLFTSGSTGRPKGVMVDHAALARRLAWLARAYDMTPRDRTAQTTQPTFDPALIELLLPLTHGASVALAPPGRLDGEAMAGFAERFEVTVMAFVPSTLEQFLAAADDLSRLRLRIACCGGEVLPPYLAERFARITGGRLFNVYGPTEACIFATAWETLPHADGGPLPIGRPVDDTRIYLLDRQLHPVPRGAAGEIVIGGGAVARGYLGQPALSAERFLPDPFLPGGRMYRSGDRGYWGSDGNLYFLGRSDRQIKLRGYRIEPAEIESALCADPAVGAAAVKLLEQEGRRGLHAWVVPRAGGLSVQALRCGLLQRLPDYMLPNGFTLLPRMPATSGGKVDYAALRASTPEHPLPTHDEAPHSDLEQRLFALWEAVLPRPPVGVHDDFFALGGDSLGALRLLAGIDELTGRRNPLSLLVEHPSVAALAAAIEHGSRQGTLLSLSREPGTVPLYLAASGHGDALRFAPLAEALAGAYTLHMLQPPQAGPRAEYHSVGDLAERYADAIQTHGTGARPLLAGFSVGGIAAIEAARRLERRGVVVAGVMLIDTVFPRWPRVRILVWRLAARLVRALRLQELDLNGRTLGSLFGDPGLDDQIRALRGHRVQACACPVALVTTSGLARWEGRFFAPWRRLFGANLREYRAPGFHGSVFRPGNVEELAATLRRAHRRCSAASREGDRPPM